MRPARFKSQVLLLTLTDRVTVLCSKHFLPKAPLDENMRSMGTLRIIFNFLSFGYSAFLGTSAYICSGNFAIRCPSILVHGLYCGWCTV